MLVYCIICVIVAVILCLISFIQLKKANQIKTDTFIEQQQQLRKIQQDLAVSQELLNKSNDVLRKTEQQIRAKDKQLVNLVSQVDKKHRQINNGYDKAIQQSKRRAEQFKQMTDKGLQNYVANLEKAYENADAGYAEKVSKLQKEYTETAASLNTLKETRKAAYEAILKQKEIKQNKDNYRLLPSSNDLEDIYTLERIKAGLHKPRILSMLIWQTYYQPIAKKQFPIILKDKTKTGIYKITNIHNDLCYIGQAVDIYKRWNDHCKAGLGIDTPVGNKLYKAMKADGLENFTFELLIECPPEELNEKEKYFIELYQSDLYGYNSQAGNRK